MKPGPKPRSLESRFLEEVTKSEGCWRWGGTKNKAGYGYIWVNELQRKDGAHRVSYRLFVGEIPEGMLVRHKCDNPSCVRPDHLELGTDKDNANDREVRGRGNPYGHKTRRRCKQGHSLPKGGACKRCKAEYDKEYWKTYSRKR